MGQRTQIAVIQESKSGDIKIDVFHQQWGYGMGLIRRLENIVNHLYSMSYEEHKTGLNLENKDLGIDLIKEYKEMEQEVSFNTLEDIKNFLKEQDNNNGYMVVKLTSCNKDWAEYMFEDVEVAFYDGDMKYRTAFANVKEEMCMGKEELKRVESFIKAFIDLHEIKEKDILAQ